ncbi:hypothetical protein [Tsukamurella tyrosinosolvens]|uniref:hypothetical protein n=1 Tax=Tsukamurella tyrosinosolvens TaxID=57704 RepID=UPI002DD433D0|nr:hypothetical protein [Tsukamurella tyrosinosolvens]MEC4614028.1 hypothetical protein [Tsukamurella tyrosinosolvens]
MDFISNAPTSAVIVVVGVVVIVLFVFVIGPLLNSNGRQEAEARREQARLDHEARTRAQAQPSAAGAYDNVSNLASVQKRAAELSTANGHGGAVTVTAVEPLANGTAAIHFNLASDVADPAVPRAVVSQLVAAFGVEGTRIESDGPRSGYVIVSL